MWGIFACNVANHFLKSGLFSIYQRKPKVFSENVHLKSYRINLMQNNGCVRFYIMVLASKCGKNVNNCKFCMLQLLMLLGFTITNGEDYCFCHSYYYYYYYYSLFFLSFQTKFSGQTRNLYRYGPKVDLRTLTQFQWPWPTFQGHRPIFVPKTRNFKSI